MKTKGYIADIVSILLILLWSYAAISKLLEFSHFKIEMGNQPIPPEAGRILIWALPSTELLAAVLLLFRQTQHYGLYTSFFLMSAFSIYVGLTYFGFFTKHACACGGVFRHMGWGAHLVFNIAILFLNIAALIFYQRKEAVFKS